MLPNVLACGESTAGYVVMRNSGASTWTAADGYALGTVDDSDPLSANGRIALPDDASIAPGEMHSFGFDLVAPAEPASVVTDWQMLRENVAWFGDIASANVDVTCTPGVHGGRVRLEDRSFADDGGPFVALGTTMMWAAWAYRNDRPRLEANLDYVAAQGFHYIRALGVVGDPLAEDYWDGREIEYGWPDYADVIAELTALAWDEYGLRIEWTFIGDGQVAVPASRQRDALVDMFVALGDARPETIIHFEIANEYWQNGFGGPEGLEELRARTLDLRGRTEILVAASAGISDGCGDMNAIYDGDIADIATVHTDRDLGTAAGPWGPVLRPVVVNGCANLPPLTNNEPIGPGASVATEEDPERLVAAALATWLAGWPAYVFHSHAGVRGDEDLSTAIGIDRFAAIMNTLPGDLASWTRYAHDDPAAAFRIYATVGGELVPDVPWTDAAGEAGVAGFLQSEADGSVVALAAGILGSATIEARVPLTVDVVDILTAQTVTNVVLAAGDRFTLDGAGARLLRATRQ
jgi:YD repeat-containing protein